AAAGARSARSAARRRGERTGIVLRAGRDRRRTYEGSMRAPPRQRHPPVPDGTRRRRQATRLLAFPRRMARPTPPLDVHPDRPLVLLSNDDGIDARGLAALASALDGLGTLAVVAPAQEQSAVGHAITVRNPMRALP